MEIPYEEYRNQPLLLPEPELFQVGYYITLPTLERRLVKKINFQPCNLEKAEVISNCINRLLGYKGDYYPGGWVIEVPVGAVFASFE